ncbi:hypothetical protein CC85DRAFT_329921 [Cutaneotrichosporon oleaginosum]|uniref:Hexosyltransferase n=1 Tax=Cutaneotrichosporon oleaginosum TaxID=879819 RepID=A0A0J0XH34_9TREE|nr:uncharacterized protein CC85DRAFT_329921 [Cutaneotrichosporon oleaginosum]KLT40395.1 hypothetical protein CC85DRAFT_329921 [Cutaneotrichosporon oleaginosum]TXT11360.1 hypothetical protein COLE_01770 [Cutaneotrichosporon oleaginosum]
MRSDMFPRRFIMRARWVALAFITLWLYWYYYIYPDWLIKWESIERQRPNLYNALLPAYLAHHYADKTRPERDNYEALPSLLNAPWPGSWPVPKLTAPKYENGTLVSPALLMLHVMSTPSVAGAERRAFLRSVTPLKTVPPEYRHLVEVRFVLGYPPDGDKWVHRKELDAEQAAHGDLFFLHGLAKGGENMNNGKTIAWMETLAAYPRPTQYIIKCDEDTLPLLPNILDWLVTLDPAQPTYFGTTLTRWWGYMHYFEGMMYGFSSNVIKTVGAAEIPKDWATQDWDEDARTGELMFSLPTKPGVDPMSIPNDHSGSFINMARNPPVMEDMNTLRLPRNPDPRSGLHRIDLKWRIADWGRWWVSDPHSALAYHRLKHERDYKEAWEKVQRAWRWRAFVWRPPFRMRSLRDPNPPKH